MSDFEQRSPDHDDYAYALAVMAEALENGRESYFVEREQRVVSLAESITRIAGEHIPRRVLSIAQTFTYESGIVAANQVMQEADEVAKYAAEVSAIGEDLPSGEIVDGTIADEATTDLIIAAYSPATRQYLEAACNRELARAKTPEERMDVLKRFGKHPGDRYS